MEPYRCRTLQTTAGNPVPQGGPSAPAATIRRTMDGDDDQRAAGVLAWLDAVWRLDPPAPSPPRLPGKLMVNALAARGLTPGPRVTAT